MDMSALFDDAPLPPSPEIERISQMIKRASQCVEKWEPADIEGADAFSCDAQDPIYGEILNEFARGAYREQLRKYADSKGMVLSKEGTEIKGPTRVRSGLIGTPKRTLGVMIPITDREGKALHFLEPGISREIKWQGPLILHGRSAIGPTPTGSDIVFLLAVTTYMYKYEEKP